MNISQERLRTEAADTDFRPEILEKSLRLLSLLETFFQHPFLKSRFALKGGTALNLFLFDVPRLSVDADLNYIGAHDRATMMAEREQVERASRAVFAREDFRVQPVPSPDEHAGGKWRLRYRSPLGGEANLEVDINFMFRVPLWPPEPSDSRALGSAQTTRIPVLNTHELAAGKLVALFSRRASRDLFDTHELLRRNDLNQTRLRTAFVAYGAMSRKDWRTISVGDISYEPNELKNELIPTLRMQAASRLGRPKPWADRLVSECAERLTSLISFTPAEREFLDRLLDHAEIKPSLITSDEALAERIAQHPLLAWKAENVRRYKKRS